MKTAGVVNSGGRQSIVLPEGIRVVGDTVFIKQVGRTIVLIPADSDPWDQMKSVMGTVSEDFMAERARKH